jgi:hypothetical protein
MARGTPALWLQTEKGTCERKIKGGFAGGWSSPGAGHGGSTDADCFGAHGGLAARCRRARWRRSSLTAHWTATTSSGEAGRRRARARTGQWQTSSATAEGNRAAWRSFPTGDTTWRRSLLGPVGALCSGAAMAEVSLEERRKWEWPHWRSARTGLLLKRK